MKVTNLVFFVAIVSPPTAEEISRARDDDSDDRFMHGRGARCMRFEKPGCRCNGCNPVYDPR